MLMHLINTLIIFLSLILFIINYDEFTRLNNYEKLTALLLASTAIGTYNLVL